MSLRSASVLFWPNKARFFWRVATSRVTPLHCKSVQRYAITGQISVRCAEMYNDELRNGCEVVRSSCEVVAKLEEIKGKFPLFEKEVEQLAVEFVHLAGVGVDVYCRNTRTVTMPQRSTNCFNARAQFVERYRGPRVTRPVCR